MDNDILGYNTRLLSDGDFNTQLIEFTYAIEAKGSDLLNSLFNFSTNKAALSSVRVVGPNSTWEAGVYTTRHSIIGIPIE